VILCVGAGALGARVVDRELSPGQGLVSTVVPAQQTTGQAQTASAAAGPAAGSFAPAQNAAPSSGFVGGPCAAAPTVQFQGRGLAATGSAPITDAAAAAVTSLSISVQDQGTDPAAVIAAATAHVDAVVTALEGAGVPSSAIRRPYFSTYGNTQAKQFNAYASIQADVPAGHLAAASSAVLQVPNVNGYSTSTGLGGDPTPQQVQAAVATAAAQARDTANATARAAGVTLGSVDSVVTQPPSVCYGGFAPARVVQVTITYAIR
jgi:uncharacterized protein YggE